MKMGLTVAINAAPLLLPMSVGGSGGRAPTRFASNKSLPCTAAHVVTVVSVVVARVLPAIGPGISIALMAW